MPTSPLGITLTLTPDYQQSRYITTLTGILQLERKRMDLKLLIHFVGDIHQPFHVGHREDLGGNKVKVTWFNVSTNLHSVWDEQLINFQQLSYTEYTKAVNHTT